MGKKTKAKFTDPRDGKVYKTVKIGKQVWLAENLAYEAKGSKCYDNDESKAKKYGRLYDWKTAMKACPPGWHLPSAKEWQTLVKFVGGVKIAGEKLKSNTDWDGTDEFGFSALPGGFAHSDFWDFGDNGFWWSSTEFNSDWACYQDLATDYDSAYGHEGGKFHLFSVRCVQDYGEAYRKQRKRKIKIGTFTDSRDGKIYKTVKIGEQVWLAENLAYKTKGSKCDDDESKGKYGRLYSWRRAMKACPDGWHLPSDEEWQTLVDFVGGEEIAGKRLKAKSGWNKNGNGTDEFGFSAMPSDGNDGYWWSSDESDGAETEGEDDYEYASYWIMRHYRDDTDCNFISKDDLYSVRCVKD